MSDYVEPLDEVAEALGLAIAYVEDVIEDVKVSIRTMVEDEKFAEIQRHTDRLESLRSFNDEVVMMLGRWRSELAPDGARVQSRSDASTGSTAPSSARSAPKRPFGRLARGRKTPQDAFRLPILQVLVEAGGSMPAGDCLAAVGRIMRERFNETDLEMLPSDPRAVRWRNTAQWSRNDMADEGLMDRSVHGVWTITPAGRDWLARRTSDPAHGDQRTEVP